MCEPILVVGLFDGLGALLVALLAMGAVVYYVSAEHDAWLSDAMAAIFENVAQLGPVQSISRMASCHVSSIMLISSVL